MALLGLHHGQQVAPYYTDLTNDIGRRVREHKVGDMEGFTRRYKTQSPRVLRKVSVRRKCN